MKKQIKNHGQGGIQLVLDFCETNHSTTQHPHKVQVYYFPIKLKTSRENERAIERLLKVEKSLSW